MSEGKLEVLRSMYEAFNQGHNELALTYLHPEPEMHMSTELPDTASYTGLAEFERGLTGWLDAWESFRYEIDGMTDVGAAALMEIRLWGIARGSGIETERAVFHLWRFRDGKPHRCDVFSHRSQALKSLGLAE
jgi:hypothetical protein